MKKKNSFIGNLFSSTYQLQRIVILIGIVLVIAAVSFGAYYYYDRYYRPQSTQRELSISQAEQELRDKPNDPAVRLALANVYLNNGRFDDAVTQAMQVKELVPDNQLPDFIIGIAYANSGKCQDSIAPLQSFVNARKDEPMPGLDRQLQGAAYFLGDCFLQMKQPQDAIPVLELNVAWARTDADAMYKLGLAYAATNQHDKAINMFVGATAFVPKYSEVYVSLAASYDAINNPARATYARGMLAYTQKDYNNALQMLLKSAQADAGFPPTMVGLGMTYEALNDLPNAKTSYEAAQNLDPNNFVAASGIERVNALLKNK